MIVPKHYENLNVLHENTMPHRAYYMPASKDMGSLVHDREKSDRMELLNGNWKFQFRESGRTMAMTAISIPMSVIQFRLIRHMYHRKIRVEHIYMNLIIAKRKKLRKRI